MLAVIGGTVALVLGTVLSLGLGLVALLGFGATALLWRGRGARLTRWASWAGCVLAVMIGFGSFGASAATQVPGGFMAEMQQSMDQASREPPPPIVQRLRKLQTPKQQQVQEQLDSVTRTQPALWASMAFGIVFTIVFIGLAVGTPAWGCAMLIGYGIAGRWPMAPPPPPPAPAGW
ncbi:MAG TPA: hypothetical protein VJT67_14070 [Longimicrobiaceae bacterium]|nr:hypothetical protein [Longimicrobiaceae bacterium]